MSHLGNFCATKRCCLSSAVKESKPYYTEKRAFCGQCVQHHADRALDPDITAAHWMTADAIRERETQLRSPLVLRSLEDYLDGKRYPVDLLIDVTPGDSD